MPKEKQRKIKVVQSALNTLLLGLLPKEYEEAQVLPTDLTLGFSSRSQCWFFKNGKNDTLCFSEEDGFEFFIIENKKPKKRDYIPESFLRRCERALSTFLIQ